MSLTDLASIGSFISGLAVVVSFIFLGLQIPCHGKSIDAGTLRYSLVSAEAGVRLREVSELYK